MILLKVSNFKKPVFLFMPKVVGQTGHLRLQTFVGSIIISSGILLKKKSGSILDIKFFKVLFINFIN